LSLLDRDRYLTLEAEDIVTRRLRADGEVVAGKLLSAGSQVHFTFQGQATMHLSVHTEAISTTLDTIVLLRGPGGEPLAYNDDADDPVVAGGGHFIVVDSSIPEYVLPEDGDYTVVVAGFDDEHIGDFEITVLVEQADDARINALLEEADSLRALGHLVAAILLYDRAAGLDPDNPQVYFGRALAYEQQGDLEAALADYSQVIDLDPDLAGPYLGRGLVYDQLDDNVQATADYWQWLSRTQTRQIDHEPLQPGKELEVTMSRGQAHYLPFDAETGQVVTVIASGLPGGAVDPLIVILDPEGEPLVGNDDAVIHHDFNSAITGYSLPVAGTYTLVVSHAGGGHEGTVAVTLTLN
jgi:hypothetical protein